MELTKELLESLGFESVSFKTQSGKKETRFILDMDGMGKLSLMSKQKLIWIDPDDESKIKSYVIESMTLKYPKTLKELIDVIQKITYSIAFNEGRVNLQKEITKVFTNKKAVL